MNGTIDINLGSKPTLTTAMHNYSASGGTANVDLSNYYSKVETDAKLNGKVSVIYGKQLSTNDYTTEEKTKLQGLSNYDSTIKQSITDEVARATAAEVLLQKNIDEKSIDLSDYDLSLQLSKYETSSAHTADIKELQSSIDGKLNKTDYISKDLSNYYNKVDVDSKLDTKVDTVDGKGLSTNDYSTVEKTKLQGLSNYDDTAINNSLDNEVARATAAELQLQKNIDEKSIDLSNYVTSSELAKYETSSAHTADVTALNSAIDGKLNKSDYAPVDLSNYYQKNQTSGATQIAAAISAISAISTTKVLTQAEYDAITSKDNNTTYIITA